eukprot:Gregarina_sp_Poly_1__1380@NODE_1342_length_4337_cov_90_491101_g901_i0_p1_GENE_NODE_1342_length_4337_cov_90_491101_g901_i0NODE_1342_length_4337_cov_90_491101_g901_i0_p1_ORF_typecomplete_len1071_score144_73CRM1_C/PF08767_11/2_8e02CRM1_C/PF08767_11/3_3e64Xpo1/PF08389_12/2e31Xpo1/PF08389_12/2_3e03Xpo1/PF08389_12/5_9e03Xpo1/PF08389_12/4_9e02Xpo1/PF08389_12/4_5e03CRM1_repeat_2/PF18784_1/2_5e21CRM1_repeat_3/PF18787_1/3_9e20CRM1_repeat/PF18777_1/1_1e07IBN_N/PF03810_19/5_5e07IBN_N/PF03810_19/1_3e03Protea
MTATLNPHSSQALRTKVNEVIVDVARRTWPVKWPTFISDLCQSAKTDQKLCENNLQILNLLSEDILDFGAEEMTSRKCQELSSRLKSEFILIFDLCIFVLSKYHEDPKSVTPSLIQTALVCLSCFIRWNPPNHIFLVDLPNVLMDHFWDPVEYRVNCVKCMGEVFGDFTLDPAPMEILTRSWIKFLGKCKSLPQQSFEYTTRVPSNARIHWETLFQHLTLTCTQFARYHFGTACEGNHPSAKSAMMQANIQPVQLSMSTLEFIVRLTKLPSDETFKICLEWWHWFADALHKETVACTTPKSGVVDDSARHPRLQLYNPVLNEIRNLIIRRMARPPEVYIIYNEEEGTVERDFQPDTDEIAAYNLMKQTLVLLSQLGGNETESLMLSILLRFTEAVQRDSSQKDWNPTLLNRLCWAIGSISGALTPVREKSFLIQVLKQLLWFCEVKRGKENKAVVASCIMYINGQYPRFLKQNGTLLRVVVMKNFEFMEDTFPGVQDMACETFFKIAKGCTHVLATLRDEQGSSFLESTLTRLPLLANQLQTIKQKIIIYHAVAVIVSGAPASDQHALIQLLTQGLNATWKQSTAMVATAIREDQPLELQVIRRITEVLQINERIADAVGVAYDGQFVQLFPDLLQLYQLYNLHFKRLIETAQLTQLNYAVSREMRSTRRASLRLVDVFINRSSQESTNARQIIVHQVLPPLLNSVYLEYRDSVPDLRDPEVLNLSASLIVKLNAEILPHFQSMFLPIFQPTLEMVNGDFDSYPEIRSAFFQFINCSIQNCFESVLSLNYEIVRNVMAALIFGIQDEKPEIAAIALRSLTTLLRKSRETGGNILLTFAKEYFMVLKQTIGVLTDTLHTAGFRDQCIVLQELTKWAHLPVLGASDPALLKANIMPTMGRTLLEAFPNLTPTQVESFVLSIFNSSEASIEDFSQHVKDFIIQLKEYGDDAPLFESETPGLTK